MEINISELMKSSKNALEGKWVLAIGTFLVFLLITVGIQAASKEYPIMGLISVLIAGPFTVGLSRFALQISRNEEAGFEDSLSGFSNFLNSFLASILSGIIIIIGIVLLIVPSVIAAITLSMTYFIIAEDDSITAVNALKKSHAMMDGYKLSYFFIILRYIALAILCILTLGIGFLWLIPYIYVTNAKFYDNIKDNNPIDILA